MLEDKFCKDFNCCGLQLNDMHELLQHFEEAHVIVEDEEMEEDDDLPFHFETTSGGGMDIDHNCNNPFGSIYGRKQIGANANNVGPQSVALSDIYQQEIVSAFETSVIRKRGAQQTEYSSQPWLRPVSDSPPKTFPIVHVPVQERSDDEYQEDVIERKAKEREIADDRDDRPYKCKIAGCNKAYKNPGGLKYHLHHGHCEDTGDPEMNNIMHKPYQCTVIDCGKRYKNLNGLKVVAFYVFLTSSIISSMHMLNCLDKSNFLFIKFFNHSSFLSLLAYCLSIKGPEFLAHEILFKFKIYGILVFRKFQAFPEF